MRKSAILAIVACAIISFVLPGYAGVPSSITVQGKLTDTGGNPISGTHNFTFRIFDAQVGGNQVWPAAGGELQSINADAEGLWIGLAGAVSPLSVAVFSDTTRWLEINVDGTTLPRVSLVTGPYAFRVGTVDGASGGTITSKVTIGTGHTNSGVDAFVAGVNNTTGGGVATITGGSNNSASGFAGVVGGGQFNRAGANYTNVDGGRFDSALAVGAVVGGGEFNTASGNESVVSGGYRNAASGDSSSIGGGARNLAIQSESTIGGGRDNTASGFGSTISGGRNNQASATESVVGGGQRNTASSSNATVAGGEDNTASGTGSAVGGGRHNHASASYAVIGGGGNSTAADSNAARGDWSVVAGGRSNAAIDTFCVVGGGDDNSAQGVGSAVTSGRNNTILDSPYGIIAGGRNNRITTEGGVGPAIIGGDSNTVSSSYSVVAGGFGNVANASYQAILGGQRNRAFTSHAAIVGGFADSASGQYSVVLGGLGNRTANSYTITGGRRAKALHSGAIVWGDNTDSDFASTANNQFLIRASGGVGVGTNSPSAPLHVQDGSAGAVTANGNAALAIERSDECWLHVLSPVGTQRGILFGEPAASIQGSIRHNPPGAGKGFHFRCGNNTIRMILDSLGNLTATGCVVGSNIACPSDARFKQDIQPLNDALHEVAKLRGVRFRWRREEFPEREFPEGDQIGLLAQEVRTVVPQAVVEQGDGYLAVDYSRLVPLLIESVKEQQARIDSLQVRLQALETRP